MPDSSTPHLVLVNLGTPHAATPEAVRAFLSEFLGDPAVVDLPRWLWSPILQYMVLRSRPARVARQYAAIWSEAGSPLRDASERIAKGVAEHADGRFGVSLAYRYGEPSLETVLRAIDPAHTGPIVVVPLFPHRTDATTGTTMRRAEEAAKQAGVVDRLVHRLIPPDETGYVAALAARWREAMDGPPPPDHLIVSFHGIPVRYARRERYAYVEDCEATTAALLREIGWPREQATLAFQSKFGPERWLQPATADVLAQLPGRGMRDVAVIAPGFMTEGLETLEELGIRGAETFLEAGGRSLRYIPAVEDHPFFIKSLASLVNGMT